jgi:hypothetical protein
MSDKELADAVYFEVDIRTILDDYMRRRLEGSDIMRLPMTGQPVYDEWIDTEKNKVMFRIYGYALETD